MYRILTVTSTAENHDQFINSLTKSRQYLYNLNRSTRLKPITASTTCEGADSVTVWIPVEAYKGRKPKQVNTSFQDVTATVEQAEYDLGNHWYSVNGNVIDAPMQSIQTAMNEAVVTFIATDGEFTQLVTLTVVGTPPTSSLFSYDVAAGTLTTVETVDTVEAAEPVALVKKSRHGARWMIAASTALLIVAGTVAASFGISKYEVPTESMLPTLPVGTVLTATQTGTLFTPTIMRGTIVTFTAPATWGDLAGKTLVKRVIGLPGDSITCTKCSDLTINNVKVDEPYTKNPDAKQGTFKLFPTETEYVVMGDDRVRSDDSRHYGPIPISAVTSVVTGIDTPTGVFHFITRPTEVFANLP